MKSVVAVRIVTIAASLLGGALYLAQFSRPERVPDREMLAGLPMVVDGWVGQREPDFNARIVAVLGVDDYVLRSYSHQASLPIGLYIGYHTSQRQGDTIHSPLNCLPGAGWQPLEQGRTTIAVHGAPAGRDTTTPIEVNRVVIGKGLDRQLVLYWYQSHRRVVASEYWGKIYTVLDAVTYNRTDAALVRLVTPIADGDRAAQEAGRRATRFVQALFPFLGRHLPS